MNNLEKLAQCPKCGYRQTIGTWLSEAIYNYKGKYVATQPYGGDHARCPECNKLISVDYDLIDIEEHEKIME